MCWRWYNKARIFRTSFTWCLNGPPACPVRSEWHEHWPSMWTISTYQSSVIEPILSHDFQFSTPWEFCKFSRIHPFSCLFSIHLLFLDVEQDTEAVIFNSVISACETLGPLISVIPVDWKTGMGSWKLCNSAGQALARRLLQDHQIPYAVCCMLKVWLWLLFVVCGLWFWLRGLVYYISFFFRFGIFFDIWFPASLLFLSLLLGLSSFPCLRASLLLCFFGFLFYSYLLLCLSASPLFCLFVHAFLLFQLLCFLVYPASLPTCFSANLFFRLLCFSMLFFFVSHRYTLGKIIHK